VTKTPRASTGSAGPPEERDDSLLSLRGLTAERGGRTVLHDVSIEIPAGQVTALLGPNGAGKSTLVLAVGGVLGLRCGSVLLDGRELARYRPERIRRAGLAIVRDRCPAHRAVRHAGARLASHAYVLEDGRLRFSGPASELRDKPELLRSAYLLRGSSGTAG
jgi:branched-chain amino acid transport system ATP-binding protein